MNCSWNLTYFSDTYFELLTVKEIFNLMCLNREIFQEYSDKYHWEKKYLGLFNKNEISENLGYKSTLKLLVYSSKLCCICLEPLWKNPNEKNYLHICDCNFSGLFLRSHENCVKKHFIDSNPGDGFF